MVAFSPKFCLGIRHAYHQAEGSPSSSLQSLKANTDNTDSEPRHGPSTHPDARCIGRAETSHDKRVHGAKDILRRGGGGGSPNRDGLASAISGALAVSWRRQHALLPNGRHRLNSIRRLRIGDRVLSDQAAVGQAFAEHFRDFYRRGPTNWWRWLATEASVLDLSQQQQLFLPFSKDEVKAALQGLNNEGAPEPDDIPMFFYKDCWDTVRHEVMAALEDFRAGRCQMDRLNKAYIVLLPKVQGAKQIGDFRPISLSNSSYLIFPKVLANRLRGVLSSLISSFQSAFIPGRQMANNIVLAEEILATWHRDGTTGFMWKVDFVKAYDSIDWHFLWNVLRCRGFPETWVRWVKQCVTTTTFAV